MKTLSIICSIIFLNVIVCVAQINPAIKWQEAFGSRYQDEASAIQVVPSGGFIVAGYASGNGGDVEGSHGSNDVWILRITNKGNVTWAKCYGGSGSDEAYEIQNTNDGGFIVAGTTGSSDGDVTGHHAGYDYWVLKLDSLGNIEWERAYGGSEDDIAQSIIETLDGGYIVAGNAKSDDGDVTGNHGNFDSWVLKLDNNGMISWEKSYGGSNGDYAHSIIQTLGGAYIIANSSSSHDGDVTGHHGTDTFNADYWIVKIDNLGNIIWEKSYGGLGFDYPSSVIKGYNNDYEIAGLSTSDDGDITNNHGEEDFWIIEIDNNGNLIRQKSFGGPGDDGANSIITTQDNGFAIGYTNSKKGQVTGLHTSGMNPGTFDIWVTKLDSKLRLLDQICLGGTNDEYGYGVVQTKNDSYVVAGSATSTDGDVTGFHGSLDPNFPDVWVVRLKQTVFDLRNENIASEDLNETEFNIYPTITTGVFEINLQTSTGKIQLMDIEVFNAVYQLALSKHVEMINGTLQAEIQLSPSLPDGMYFIKARFDNEQYTGKILLERMQ